MIKRLNFEANIPSADTIHNDIIKSFKDEKEFIKKKLQVYYIFYKLFINLQIFYLIYFYKFVGNTK
jgi:hypothetical protein